MNNGQQNSPTPGQPLPFELAVCTAISDLAELHGASPIRTLAAIELAKHRLLIGINEAIEDAAAKPHITEP